MRLELPCPILLRSSYPEVGRRLGLSPDDIERVLWGSRALRDGRVFDVTAFANAYPDDLFDDFTGDDCFPDDLLVRSFEVPRDPATLLTPPITEFDRAAADAWVAIRRHRKLAELNAPGLLLAPERSNLRQACDAEKDAETPWQPMSELMTGAPAKPGAAGEAHPMFGVPFGEVDPTVPGDAAWLPDGLVVFWPYVTIVFGFDGRIRDVFASRGLRAIGGDARFLGLVCGGGGVASSGYFGAEVFVRDLEKHEWLTRGSPIPASIPRYVAGTIGDVKWAVVVDTLEGIGYRTSPRASGDQCGETFNSACGRYAWDRGRFVLEAATGKAVLDVDRLEGQLLGFAHAERPDSRGAGPDQPDSRGAGPDQPDSRGAGPERWRFLMLAEPGDDELPEDVEPPPSLIRLVDETGAVLRTLERATVACALSADASQLVEVAPHSLTVTDCDSGRRLRQLDLSTLTAALELPRRGALWQNLAAAFGVPSRLPRERAAVRAALDRMWDSFDDKALAGAITQAKKRLALPERVPVRRG